MRVRNVSFRLVLPGVLVGLVVLLAVLQYQWLGKVSEAERAQMLRSLTQRAREFADEFDAEMMQAYRAHQVSRDAVLTNRFDGLVESVARWQGTAKYPQVVKAVYLAERAGNTYTLRAMSRDHRSFDTPPLPAWPAHLEPVRTQLGSVVATDARTAGKPQIISITLMPALPDVPALVVPASNQTMPSGPIAADSVRPPAANPTMWMHVLDACLIVDLDADYLKTVVLPELAARHFPDLGANGYRLAVVSSSGAPLFVRDVPDGQSLNPDRADVTQSFFSVRPDMSLVGPPGSNTLVVRSLVAPSAGATTRSLGASPVDNGRLSVLVEQRSAGTRGAPGPASMSGTFKFLLPAWRVVLQHQSGSLDAAVSQVRHRNLLLSFGILGVLTAGVVIVIVNARRTEQLAARRMDFVATVSHELRTPLAVIRSAAQNLSAGVVSDPAHARRYGELIDGEGRRLTDMVEQVMALAGLESGRPLQGTRPVDVPALVSDVMISCASLCDAAGITVEVNAGRDADIPPVMADEAALRRALQNLVTNAVKHGADGRWIGVTVSAPVVRGGREVQIVIGDRGRGIDAADLAHVFEPFHRGRHAAEQQVHGNGLGLHLVKLIASAHGGRVSVQSTPGHGATFTLHLPAAPSDTRATT
ncbi:MAG: HAMP domain-containing sensor histidine kinase [Acidobacteria bacterium]|nr:HAMP domain-containing sensor histidine kinase [Acidobacteriota bacterium]